MNDTSLRAIFFKIMKALPHIFKLQKVAKLLNFDIEF